MGEYSEVFVAFDVAKRKHAVAVAESGRRGEVRFLGEIGNNEAAIERTLKKLSSRHGRLHVCFEAGPTGYGLYRQAQALGHACTVVAPGRSRGGLERVKTNRRDAVTLARLHRAGELTGNGCPTPFDEAVHDLARPRGGGGRSSSQAPAAAFLPAAAQPDLQRRRPLDAGASTLARPSEVRTCRAADRLSGRH